VKTALGAWVDRPLERLDPDVLPFWDGLNADEFRLCRCRRCHAHWFPFQLCPNHADIVDFDEMEWAPTSGRGMVFAKLVVHRVWDPDFMGEVPYVLAMIALDEGPLFPGRMIDCRPDDVEIGMAVAVHIHHSDRGHSLPLFRLASRRDRGA
jgi:uncharacterized OB-fold protein